MAIKMRNNKNPDAICDECYNTADQSLGMFDICICGNVFTVCDLCTDKILNKTLAAVCSINGKVKSQHDLAIIRKRNSRLLEVEE